MSEKHSANKVVLIMHVHQSVFLYETEISVHGNEQDKDVAYFSKGSDNNRKNLQTALLNPDICRDAGWTSQINGSLNIYIGTH